MIDKLLTLKEGEVLFVLSKGHDYTKTEPIDIYKTQEEAGMGLQFHYKNRPDIGDGFILFVEKWEKSKVQDEFSMEIIDALDCRPCASGIKV